MANSRAGIAFAVFCLIHFNGSDALGDDSVSGQLAAAEPICTITDEAKCWSPAEVENALSLIFCGGGDQPCQQPELSKAGLHIELSEVTSRPPATKVRPAEPEREPVPEPAEPKLDASGVPEFNAWEEGCD